MMFEQNKSQRRASTGLQGILLIYLVSSAFAASGSAPDAWQDNLTPLPASSWTQDTAAHLLERAVLVGGIVHALPVAIKTLLIDVVDV